MKKVIILFLALALVGCKSKQKTVERSDEKVETSLELAGSEKSVTNVLKDSASSRKTETSISEKNNITVDEKTEVAEVIADGGGVVGIEKATTQTGSITIFSGVQSLRLTDTKKQTLEQIERQTYIIDSLSNRLILQAAIYNEKLIKLQQAVDYEKSQRNAQSNSFGLSNWIWILLFIIVVLVAYWNRRKILSWFT